MGNVIQGRQPGGARALRKLNQLWFEIDLGAPALGKRLLVEPAKRVVLPLVRPHRRHRRLDGENAAGELSLSYLGRFRRDLIFPRKCFFSSCTLTEAAGKVPFWRVGAEAMRPDTDLHIVNGGPRLVAGLPKKGAVVLPARLDAILDLRPPWDEIRRGFRKSAKELLRIYKRHDYGHRISHDPADFEHFYEQWYLPTTRRHGELANPIFKGAARVYFKRGFLFYLTEDGKDLAAALCKADGKTLRLVCDGLPDGDPRAARRGRLGALFIARFQWAREQGFEAVNFLSTAPCYSDPLLRSKRRWGSRLQLDNRPQSRLWLHTSRLTPAVVRCLEDNPLIVIDENKNLDALVVVPDPETLDRNQRRRLRKIYGTRGLRRVLACSAESFTSDEGPVAHAREI